MRLFGRMSIRISKTLKAQFQQHRFFSTYFGTAKSLIQQKPFEKFTRFWNAFRDVYPTWPGFCSERCDPTLMPELERETEKMIRKLDRLFAKCKRGPETEGADDLG